MFKIQSKAVIIASSEANSRKTADFNAVSFVNSFCLDPRTSSESLSNFGHYGHGYLALLQASSNFWPDFRASSGASEFASHSDKASFKRLK
jgi:hypothetical protein